MLVAEADTVVTVEGYIGTFKRRAAARDLDVLALPGS